MKAITKDIILTLCCKLIGLILLWIVCFKGVEKNPVGLAQWLYGSTQTLENQTFSNHR